MAEPTQAELMSLLTGAIARSHLHDPVRIDGTTWDNMNVSNEEASHYAKARLPACRWRNRYPATVSGRLRQGPEMVS
jgi:hypothetical protein